MCVNMDCIVCRKWFTGVLDLGFSLHLDSVSMCMYSLVCVCCRAEMNDYGIFCALFM